MEANLEGERRMSCVEQDRVGLVLLFQGILVI